ncbi:MAG: hypothetical protein JRJ87_05090 [Deltaproteobacteria bacterium]|nr:hypothetical protein [Deltaproteobacteria bacterium]
MKNSLAKLVVVSACFALGLTGCEIGGEGVSPECNYDVDCGPGLSCIAEECVSPVDLCASEHDCAWGQTCVDGVCKDPCASDDECPAGNFCDRGDCRPGCRSDADCPAGSTCFVALYECVKTGCESDDDCAAGEKCNFGECVAVGCVIDEDCPAGEKCNFGECVAADCVLDEDCPIGEQCLNGSCELAGCQTDADCMAGQHCQDGACTVIVGCANDSDCGPDQQCVAGTCETAGCQTDADCLPDESCIAGACQAAQCLTDSDCPPGQLCQSGVCVSGDCQSDYDCLPGEFCSGGSCISSGCLDSNTPIMQEVEPNDDLITINNNIVGEVEALVLRGIANNPADSLDGFRFQCSVEATVFFTLKHECNGADLNLLLFKMIGPGPDQTSGTADDVVEQVIATNIPPPTCAEAIAAPLHQGETYDLVVQAVSGGANYIVEVCLP